MKPLIPRIVLAAALACGSSPVQAWSSHALCTWQALGMMSEVTRQQVKTERLSAFLIAERAHLPRLLLDQEAWSRAHLTDYPPRPDALAFVVGAGDTAPDEAAALVVRFLQAVRLNPNSRLPLFLELRPGDAGPDRPHLPWADVAALGSDTAARENSYVMLRDGETVSVLDVVAAASDEPDYGLDIGLWADNGTDYGARFGFGTQPFGNAALDYSSQAPFHMGFFHESPIVVAAASFLKRTQVEYRVQLFQTLAAHAFATGHPYWGWRFTGWALHYVQDLTQPYHARMLPGVGIARMLWIQALDTIGFPAGKDDAINLVTNRHWVIEDYQFHRMRKAYERGDMNDALLRGLRDTAGDGTHRFYRHESMREVVSAEAASIADEVDRALERSFARYTSDPGVVLGNRPDPPDMYTIALQSPAAGQAALETHLTTLMTRLGRHSRALVRAVLEQAKRR